MKGRTTFTRQEAAELRRLIAEKRTADRGRQKTLRARVRAIGFYITDFVTDQRGFTVSDFDHVVARGVIVVVESGETRLSPPRAARQKAVSPTSSRHSAEERGQARARRELTARRYKPERIDLLLVAEAPPSVPDRYFYFPDVAEQDSLFRYVSRALLGREPTREGKADLLAELRDRGVFLIDLEEEPRDETPLSEFVPALVKRCSRVCGSRRGGTARQQRTGSVPWKRSAATVS